MASTTNNIIKITSLPIITSFPVQFPLIRYGSGSSDFLLGSLPAGYVGSLVNAVGSVDLLISSGPITIRPITWTGTPNGNWDLSTPNWLYLGSPTTYNQADFVTFDDSASGVTGVNLTTSLAPGSLTVSNITKDYTFNGTESGRRGIGQGWPRSANSRQLRCKHLQQSREHPRRDLVTER